MEKVKTKQIRTRKQISNNRRMAINLNRANKLGVSLKNLRIMNETKTTL